MSDNFHEGHWLDKWICLNCACPHSSICIMSQHLISGRRADCCAVIILAHLFKNVVYSFVVGDFFKNSLLLTSPISPVFRKVRTKHRF